ncbi:ras-related protein Rab-24 [Nephila pilipes]|uniref:Ras-related protein Rab-24 n=1 Tax=Nephila pilipes TaxID=299642 RepID=A0A8X6KIN3_NEPPI|nr:ras-related protein Rab-24 [Nephila pilipes]
MSERPLRKNKNRKRSLAELKVVMIGDASVGKTCLVVRYMDREYKGALSTIGASFVLKTWGMHDIAIWDTAGQEKYAGMTTFYYRNASAAVLAFDMFDRTSFYNLNQRYIPILNDVASAKLKVIVATKSDLLETCVRQVSKEEGIELAKKSNPNLDLQKHALPYFETSAKTGHSVDELFEYIFEHFYPGGFSPPTTSDEFAHRSIRLDDAAKPLNSHCCFH